MSTRDRPAGQPNQGRWLSGITVIPPRGRDRDWGEVGEGRGRGGRASANQRSAATGRRNIVVDQINKVVSDRVTVFIFL